MHDGRAPHEREAALLRCKAVLPRASPGPHFVRWFARVARLRATALALSGDEAQHARLLHARAAPRWRQSINALWKGTARARSRPSSGQGRAPTCQPCPSLREVACACSALERLCTGSLWGRGLARALPTRARRTALATLGPRTMEGHCTSEKPPFLRRQPKLPHARRAPHCARWLARVARLRASVLVLSGDEAQHVRFRRTHAPPRWRQSIHALWNGTARARSRRSFGTRPCSHMPALPLTSRGGLRV